MRLREKKCKTRRHFCWLPVRAQSYHTVHSEKVWLEWVEVGYDRFLTHKIYYLIEK